MKIIHLVQRPQFRGAEIFASQMAMHMCRLGHQAILVFLYPGTSVLPFTGKTYHLDGVQAKRLTDIQAWKKLAYIINKEKPDIIQANAGDTLKYAVLSKLIFRWRQPIVFRNASTISLYIKSTSGKRFNSFFFQHATKIISVSNTSAADFAALFPHYKSRITTIPIGIENTVTVGPEKPVIDGKCRSQGPVLLHVGGFSFEKNHFGLISIFEKILRVHPGASLHLIGDGPLKDGIEKLVQQKRLQDRVVFYGFQSNAMQFMKSADVLLLPSIIEGLPGVILEAFFCKTPVVAYDAGGIKEVLYNGRTGRLIRKGDEEAFVDGVIKALNENPANDKLIENAHRLVTAQYLNSRIAKEFLNVYNSIVLKNRNHSLVW